MQLSVEVFQEELDSPSMDKSAPTRTEQHHDMPPLYALPENASTITPSPINVTVDSLLPHQSISEIEWHIALRELQNNLSALNQARCFDTFPKSDRRRFLKSLFNSKSVRPKGAQGPQIKESDIEHQARGQRIRVLEELVLSGMRMLARTHQTRAWIGTHARRNSRRQFARAT